MGGNPHLQYNKYWMQSGAILASRVITAYPALIALNVGVPAYLIWKKIFITCLFFVIYHDIEDITMPEDEKYDGPENEEK